MPENFRWVPGNMPSEFELPPILIWRKGDNPWRSETATPVAVAMENDKLLKKLGGPAKSRALFVAYRMNFADSQSFRHNFQSAVQSHPDLSHVKVIDGHVYAGETWAETIRYRIRTSKLVVGDVTGMRSDVLFELGFAYGLKKPVIPVVENSPDASDLPRWLNATQLGFFGTEDGMLGIVSSVAKYLADPDYFKTQRALQPIPSLAVWLRKFTTCPPGCALTRSQRKFVPEPHPSILAMPTDAPLDLQICPLCGDANSCAMATSSTDDQTPLDCWCMTVKFDAMTLAKIPNSLQNKVCICKLCAQNYVLNV